MRTSGPLAAYLIIVPFLALWAGIFVLFAWSHSFVLLLINAVCQHWRLLNIYWYCVTVWLLSFIDSIHCLIHLMTKILALLDGVGISVRSLPHGECVSDHHVLRLLGSSRKLSTIRIRILALCLILWYSCSTSTFYFYIHLHFCCMFNRPWPLYKRSGLGLVLQIYWWFWCVVNRLAEMCLDHPTGAPCLLWAVSVCRVFVPQA